MSSARPRRPMRARVPRLIPACATLPLIVATRRRMNASASRTCANKRPTRANTWPITARSCKTRASAGSTRQPDAGRHTNVSNSPEPRPPCAGSRAGSGDKPKGSTARTHGPAAIRQPSNERAPPPPGTNARRPVRPTTHRPKKRDRHTAAASPASLTAAARTAGPSRVHATDTRVLANNPVAIVDPPEISSADRLDHARPLVIGSHPRRSGIPSRRSSVGPDAAAARAEITRPSTLAAMESIGVGELVKVADDGPELDGIVFDTPSSSKVIVAVVDRVRGPVFRTVHPSTLSARTEEIRDDRALRLLVRRTPPPVHGAARAGSTGGRGRTGHARGAAHRPTGR